MFFSHNQNHLKKLLFRGQKAKSQGYDLLSKYYFWLIRKKYNVYIHPNATISKSVVFPHPTSIVIGAGVVIGDNVTIYQNVTIGGARRGDWKSNNYPTINEGVTLFAGSVIAGKVSIGKNVTIGANAVVLNDIPSNKTAVGVPASVIN